VGQAVGARRGRTPRLQANGQRLTQGVGALRGGTSQPKFFYGWVIVGVLSLASMVGMAMGGLSFGLFIKPMGDELGIGRAVFGWAQTARQVTSALTSPRIGQLIDRFGVRVLLPVAIAISALAMAGLAMLTEGWQLVVLFGVMGVAGLSGGASMLTSVPIAKWFIRGRGRAMAIATLGTPVGGVIFVPLTQVLIDSSGWRATWLILAAGCAGIMIPLALIFLRRQPEDMGLLPDGGTVSRGSSTTVAARDPEVSWTRHDAIRTATFWRLVFVFSVVMLGQGTVGVHRIPSFMDRGIDPTLVAYATAVDAAAASLSLFALGFIADRFDVRYLGAAGFLFVAAGIYLTLQAEAAPMMFASTALFGLGIGGNLLLQNYIWAEYYGRRNLGAIRGVVQPITLVFGGIGPPLAGYVRDVTGTYDAVWWAGLGLILIGAVTLVTTPRPNAVAS
jgi:MFS family permease